MFYFSEDKTVTRPKSRVSFESSSCPSQEEVTGSLRLYDDGTSAKFNDE